MLRGSSRAASTSLSSGPISNAPTDCGGAATLCSTLLRSPHPMRMRDQSCTLRRPWRTISSIGRSSWTSSTLGSSPARKRHSPRSQEKTDWTISRSCSLTKRTSSSWVTIPISRRIVPVRRWLSRGGRISALCRGPEYDRTVLDVDGLLLAVPREVENARFALAAETEEQIGDRRVVQLAARRVLRVRVDGVRVRLHLLDDSEDPERPEVLIDVVVREEDAAADVADADRALERGEDQLLGGTQIEVFRDRAAL